MVTKQIYQKNISESSLILAKIHMVTKLDMGVITQDDLSYSSKNPYGNKTNAYYIATPIVSYSSKNPYGNKTKSNEYST